MKFALFDAVALTEATTLAEGQVVPAGAHGAIVEVFDQGAAYFIEVFGEWVQRTQEGKLVLAQPEEPAAFMETLGVACIAPAQLRLRQPAEQTVGEHARLYAVVAEMPVHLVKEVADFAEFLSQKTIRQAVR